MIKRFNIGSVFGIPLQVDITLLVVIPFIAWAIARDITVAVDLIGTLTGVQPAVETVSTGVWPWALGVLAAVGLFCSITLHELGHSLVAIRRGYDIESIQLWLLGGVAEFDEQPETWRDELEIALAGPAVSVALGVAGLALLFALPASVPRLQFLVGYLGVLNIVVAGFNMLPGFPMDGGRVLRAMLLRNRSLPAATDLAATVGKGVALWIGILGIVTFNLLLLAIAGFVYLGASAEAQQTRLKSTFEGTTVGDLMTQADDVETVAEDETVAAMLDRMFSERHTGYPVVENGAVQGIVTLEDVSRLDSSRDDAIRVASVMSRDPITVDPDTPAIDALERMDEENIGRLVVTDESGALVGLVSRTDLMTAASIARQRPQVDWNPGAETGTGHASG
jgi:Zn-dependent protease/CBS domain-containing protein